jgi:hypothetical protein
MVDFPGNQGQGADLVRNRGIHPGGVHIPDAEVKRAV